MSELIRVFIGALILGVVAFCLTVIFNAYQSNGNNPIANAGKKNKKHNQTEQTVNDISAEQPAENKPIITQKEQEMLDAAQKFGKKGMQVIDKIKNASANPASGSPKQKATFAMGDNTPAPIDLPTENPPAIPAEAEEEIPYPTAQTTQQQPIATNTSPPPQQYALKTKQQNSTALRYINDIPETPQQNPTQIAPQYLDNYDPQGKYKIQLIILTRTSVNLAPYYAQLADLGSVYVEPITSLQVRILLGNYNNRDAANNILKEVRKRGFKDAFLKK